MASAKQGNVEYTTLGEHTRAELSAAIVTLAESLHIVMQELFRSSPPQTSLAGSMRENESDIPGAWLGKTPISDSHRAIYFSCITALDHVRLFGRSLVDQFATFSMATLTRGAIEAYGRAWWILNASDRVDLLHRWGSAMCSELAMVGRADPGGQLQLLHGGTIRVEDLRRQIQEDVEHLAGKKIINVRPTPLAHAMLDAIGSHSGSWYSHLSGVAHGESLAIHGFWGLEPATNGQPGRFVLSLPARSALDYSVRLLSTTDVVFSALLQYVGAPSSPTDSWVVAKTDLSRLIRSIK